MIRSKAVYVIRNRFTGKLYSKAAKGIVKTSEFEGAYNIYDSVARAQQVLTTSDLLRGESGDWEIVKMALVDGDSKSVSDVISSAQSSFTTIKAAVNDYFDSLEDETSFTVPDVFSYIKAFYKGKEPHDGTIARYIRERRALQSDVICIAHNAGVYQKAEWIC